MKFYINQIITLLAFFLLGMAQIGCDPQGAPSTKVTAPELLHSSGGRHPLLDKELQAVAFTPEQPAEWSLPNGLTVLFLRDEELPLVRGVLYLKGGTLWEDEDNQGLIGALGSQMRQGGAGQFSAAELDRVLEELSASVESGFDSEYGSVAFQGLSGDFDQIFSIFSNVVRNPLFEQDRLSLWKGQSLESIRRRVDDPATVASIAFRQLVYRDSPFGRVTLSRNIEAIERSDLLIAHDRFVRPSDAILVVTGSITREDLQRAVEEKFSDWSQSQQPLESLPKIARQPEAGIFFLEMPFSQATIYLGHQGVERHTEDQIAIEGFNHVFGAGGFTSRLTRRIRSELGLAYSVYGAILPGPVRGRNLVFVQTKAESAGPAIIESINTILALKSETVTEDELTETQRAIESAFVFRFDSPQKIASRRAVMRLLGYPDQYDNNYIGGIQRLKPDEIRDVAARRWNIDGLNILVVGNREARDSLESVKQGLPEPLRDIEITELGFDEQLLGL